MVRGYVPTLEEARQVNHERRLLGALEDARERKLHPWAAKLSTAELSSIATYLAEVLRS